MREQNSSLKERAEEEAKQFNTMAKNGQMVRVVGDFAYDKQDRSYQWINGSLFPLRFGGWVLVNNKPLPTAVSGKPSKRRRAAL